MLTSTVPTFFLTATVAVLAKLLMGERPLLVWEEAPPLRKAEIPLPELPNVNVALIQLASGTRYPAEGLIYNIRSDMCVHVLEGSVSLFIQGYEFTPDYEGTLSGGDTIVVQALRPYFWDCLKDTTFIIVSSPPWTLDQQAVPKG